MADYIASIDQGTTSTRCLIFNRRGVAVGCYQLEHRQHYPRPGWVEHDPLEIWEKTQLAILGAFDDAGLSGTEIAAVGITNQRETTVVWDKSTGQPYHNAIVWQDTRSDEIIARLAQDGGMDRFRSTTGLPLTTYSSGPKIAWLLENVADLRQAAMEGRALFGNIDSWIIWHLTGGPKGGVHVTDATNASRTMLMNLESLSWDEAICRALEIPMDLLPKISSSSEIFGSSLASGPFGAAIPIAGDLGDQQAAMVGQACFGIGEAKNTYGTGCFMLQNTGSEVIHSRHGLLSTVGYKFGDEDAVYALEGSIAVTGALVQWLRDNLGVIDSAQDVELLANSVEDNGGIYFVPAFSGLYAPYWRPDARGAIVGLTRFINKGHIARAALEATAYQSREVLEAMNADSGMALKALKVDGGMVHNEFLMQFQADVLGVPVIRPAVSETTALGAAYAAGYAVGFWKSKAEMKDNWRIDKIWQPDSESKASTEFFSQWKKAVTRTFDWIE